MLRELLDASFVRLIVAVRSNVRLLIIRTLFNYLCPRVGSRNKPILHVYSPPVAHLYSCHSDFRLPWLPEHAASLIVGNKIEKFCHLTTAIGFQIHLEGLDAGKRFVVAVASLVNAIFSGRRARSPPNPTPPLFPLKFNSVTSAVLTRGAGESSSHLRFCAPTPTMAPSVSFSI